MDKVFTSPSCSSPLWPKNEACSSQAGLLLKPEDPLFSLLDKRLSISFLSTLLAVPCDGNGSSSMNSADDGTSGSNVMTSTGGKVRMVAMVTELVSGSDVSPGIGLTLDTTALDSGALVAVAAEKKITHTYCSNEHYNNLTENYMTLLLYLNIQNVLQNACISVPTGKFTQSNQKKNIISILLLNI